MHSIDRLDAAHPWTTGSRLRQRGVLVDATSLISPEYESLHEPYHFDMMKITPALLRRTLKVLGYTNQSLADELSEARSDGQRTSPATVSRWVSGAQPMEAALLLYLRERLMSEAIRHAKPRLTRAHIIGVGGAKGGCGSSTIAMGLALAAHELGYRSALKISDPQCNALFDNGNSADLFKVGLRTFGVTEVVVAEQFDLVFLDLKSRLFTLTPKGERREEISICDFLVVPAHLRGDAKDPALTYVAALDGLKEVPPWAILQSTEVVFPSYFDVADALGQWKAQLLPRPISWRTDAFRPDGRGSWTFTSEEIDIAFHECLEDLFDRMELPLERGVSTREEASSLSWEELVGSLEQQDRESPMRRNLRG